MTERISVDLVARDLMSRPFSSATQGLHNLAQASADAGAAAGKAAASHTRAAEQVERSGKQARRGGQETAAGFRDAGRAAGEAEEGVGRATVGMIGSLGSLVLKVGVAYVAYKGLAALTQTVAGVFTGGLERLQTIQDASASLTVQFGGDAAKTKKFMDSILETVKGTPYALDQFANVGKNLVAFGIDAGKVPKILTSIGDAAAASGQGAEAVDQLADTFGKLAAQGKVDLGSIWDISAKGIPALQILSNHFGETTADMTKLISKGKVNAVEAIDALVVGIEEGSKGLAGPTQKFGGSMDAIGKTLTGSTANFKTALNRLGANILSPWLDDMTATFGGATGLVDKFGKAASEWSKNLHDWLLPRVKDLAKTVVDAWSALTKGLPPGEVAKATPLAQHMAAAHDMWLEIKPDLKLAWEALWSGETLSGAIGSGTQEDPPIVKFAKLLREWGLQQFDKFKSIWESLKSTFVEISPDVMSIAKSLGEASAAVGLSSWDIFLTTMGLLADLLKVTLVPALDWLAGFMRDNPAVVTTVIAAYTAYKVAMLGVAGATIIANAATGAWHAMLGVSMLGSGGGAAASGVGGAAAAGGIGVMGAIGILIAFGAAYYYVATQTEWGKEHILKALDEQTAKYAESVVAGESWADTTLRAVQTVAFWFGIDFAKMAGDADYQGSRMASNASAGVSWGWQIVQAVQVTAQAFGIDFTRMSQNSDYMAGRLASNAAEGLSWGQQIVGAVSVTAQSYGISFSSMSQNADYLAGRMGSSAAAGESFGSRIMGAVDGAASSFGIRLGDMRTALSGFVTDMQTKAQEAIGGLSFQGLSWSPTGGFNIDTRTTETNGSPNPNAIAGAQIAQAARSIHLAEGGQVRGPGGPRADRVPLWGSDGEFMVNAASYSKHQALVEAINADEVPRYAKGGLISSLGDAVLAPALSAAGAAASASAAVVDATSRAMQIGAQTARAQMMSAAGGGSFGGPYPEGTRGKFMQLVASQMGTEYFWTGDQPPLFDCSGLMSWALREAGVMSGRLTAQDFNTTYPHVATAKPGDLVTFDTGRLPGAAGHIGMVLDAVAQTMMHTDGAGPARTSGYAGRDGGPLSFLDPIGGEVKYAAGQSGGDPVSISVGVGVERWRGTVLQALKLIGQPASWADRTLMQMNTESSGDPWAQNNTDSNARAGTPSRGLLQLIQPTFDWMGQFSPIPFNNILDPLQNIIAGMLWELHNTGSLGNWSGHAYDQGGVFAPGPGVNLSGRDEFILNPAQTAQLKIGGGSGRAQQPQGRTITVEAGAVQIVVQGDLRNAGQVRAELEHALRAVLQDDLERQF